VSGREQVTRWREWLWIGLLIDFVLEAWHFDAFCYSVIHMSWRDEI
jgi:hypothetical protein